MVGKEQKKVRRQMRPCTLVLLTLVAVGHMGGCGTSRENEIQTGSVPFDRQQDDVQVLSADNASSAARDTEEHATSDPSAEDYPSLDDYPNWVWADKVSADAFDRFVRRCGLTREKLRKSANMPGVVATEEDLLAAYYITYILD